DDVRTTIAYFADLSNYIVGIPDNITVTNVAGTVLRHREADIEAGTGNLLQVRQYLETGDVAATDMAYFSTGMLRRVTGPPNLHGQRYAVDFEYDQPTQSHITAMTDSFGYHSTVDYDLRFGLQHITTDINGNQTDYEYDIFGRTVTTSGPYEIGG